MCVVKFCLPQMQAVQEPVPASCLPGTFMDEKQFKGRKTKHGNNL